MSKLASIQRIKTIVPHTNADSLEIAELLGWQVVVKKGEFSQGELCVYVQIDSLLPDKPAFEFLRNKNFRIKPIRLRGQSSNGICFPLSILGESKEEYSVDDDVTQEIGVTKYEKPISTQLAGDVFGHMPGFLSMTDEDNLRNYPDALLELQGHEYYITRKDDGCLDGSTLITTKNGQKPIKELYESNSKEEILTFNVDSNKKEYHPIEDSFISENDHEWFEITLDDNSIIKITGNHKVWMPELKCYRRVMDLNKNDVFLVER